MKIWHTESACSSHLRDWQIIQNTIPKFQRTLNMLEADVIIVYLCGISAMALEANKKELNRLKFAKSRKHNVKIFVGGCATDLIDVQKQLGGMKFINGIFTKQNMAEVVLDGLHLQPAEKPATFVRFSTASINIAAGCRRRCAFCKTWYLDMDYKSVPKETIFEEIDDAINRGILHVCITAENTTEYGIEEDGKGHLLELLKEIFEKFPEIKIMDVAGVCLDEMDNELVDYFLSEPRINMIQLEVQSFTPEVRAKMNLRKTAEEAKVIYLKLRSSKIVKSNIITGHPGETLENFSAQLKFIVENREKCWSLDLSPFDNTPGTRSYEMEQPLQGIYDATKRCFLEAVVDMRNDWLLKLLEARKPVRAYGLVYDDKRDRTFCMMWGQPVMIEVTGKLPLYQSYSILLTSYSDIVGTDNNIMCAGKITM